MLTPSSHRSDAPRQPNSVNEAVNQALEPDLDLLNLKEVAAILRVGPASMYRLIAKRALPVYRACRKVLFKKKDVLDYLERHRKDSLSYGGSED